MSTASEPARRVGRPRRDQRRLNHAPEEEILLQAAKLFSTKRFEATSTREIAEASGLQQSSLFHYFKSKEDILVALSERANDEPIANLERISAMPISNPAKLYLVVESHMRVACADRGAWRAVLENSHTLSWTRFRRYLAQEERYSGGIREIIAAAIEEGAFVDEPPGLATARILGMCNWSLRWFKRSGSLSVDEIAADFATSALRSLAQRSEDIAGYVAEAVTALGQCD